MVPEAVAELIAQVETRLSAKLDASNKKFVLRGGKPHELADKDIVVGDVLTFNSHNLASIPCDGLLLSVRRWQ